jgi:hypothetical protein
MRFGRMIRVKDRRGDPEARVYVVAEPDASKAIDIIKGAGLGRDDIEDLGRVTDTLLKTLGLQPGQFVRT